MNMFEREDTIFDDLYKEFAFIASFKYSIWKCCGCNSITLEEKYTAPYMDKGKYEATFYPPQKINHIDPKHFIKLSPKLQQIYRETILAYNSEMYLLCTAGLRALIEGICVDKKITGQNLEKKIEGLVTILPANIIEGLHDLRFMGNDAIHELLAPKRTELNLAIKICEDLLNFLYDLDYKTRLLKTHRLDTCRRERSEDF